MEWIKYPTFISRHTQQDTLATWQKNLIANKYNLLIVTAAINILSLAFPVMTIQVYDRILIHPHTSTLYMLMIGVIIAIILETILRIIRTYVIAWTGAMYEHAVICNAIHHLLHVDLQNARKYTTGQQLQHLSSISRLRDFFSGQAMIILADLPFVIIFLGLIYYLGGALVIITLLLLGGFIFFAWKIGLLLRKQLHEREVLDDHRYQFIIEILAGIHTVKSFGLESILQRRYEHIQSESNLSSYTISRLSVATANMGAVFSQLMIICMVGAGSLLVIDGELTIGTLVACVLLSGRIMQPIQRAFSIWTRFQDFQLAKQRMDALFALPELHEHDAEERLLLSNTTNHIRLENVTFFPQDKDTPTLCNINLELVTGQTTLICGDDIRGKHILLKLLAGLYKPSEGMITIDGVQPHTLNAWERQHMIAHLTANGAVFQGNILDNLTGYQIRKEQEAMVIAQELGIDTAMAKLPAGYKTLIEDSYGDSIAPGLKQRIALARRLLEHPRIVLFDSADIALDRAGLMHLYRYLKKYQSSSIIVLATTDMQLMSLANHAIHLDNGVLMEGER